MSDPQHTLKVRIGKQIVTINCPPFASNEQLDVWLIQFRDTHPDSVIVSKSWSTNAAA